MKKIIIFIFSNAILFLTLQCSVVLTAFLLGFASSDKYVRAQWVLYCIFCLLHVVIYVAIPYFKRSLSRYELLLGALIIILSWIITGWYIS